MKSTARNLPLVPLCFHVYMPYYCSWLSGHCHQASFLGTVYFEKWCSQHRIQLFLSVLTVDHYILFYSSTPYNSCLSGQCHQAPFLETVYFEKSCLQSAFNSFPRLTFHLIGQANTSSQDHHLLQNLTERSALTTNGNPNLTTLKWDG